jgi:hypothetical protein
LQNKKFENLDKICKKATFMMDFGEKYMKPNDFTCQKIKKVKWKFW